MSSFLETLFVLRDRDEAVGLIVASRLSALGRESAYRLWCARAGVDPVRADLDRVRTALPRPLDREAV